MYFRFILKFCTLVGMEFKYLQNRTTKSATLLLYGNVGNKVDGDHLAHEINYLGQQVDELNLRINSEGGNVLQGLSVFSALLNTTAQVNIFIDGIAASIAGVIAMAGDKIYMNDFAKLMIHDPLFSDKKTLSTKQKNALTNIKDSLVTILSRRGKDRETVSDLMSAETWFSAQDAQKDGFIDEVIETGKAIINEGGSLAEMVNECQNLLTIKKPKKQKMLEIINSLGLGADATETEATVKIGEMKNSIETLTAEKATQTEEINGLKKTIAEQVVNQAIQTGKIKEDSRAEMVELGAKDMKTLENVLKAVKEPVSKIVDQIEDPTKKKQEKTEDKETFAYLSKNDPVKLENMMKSNPDKFQELLNEYEG